MIDEQAFYGYKSNINSSIHKSYDPQIRPTKIENSMAKSKERHSLVFVWKERFVSS